MFFRSSPFRFISIFLLALIIFSFAAKTFAQLDPTFGTNGVVRTGLGGSGTTIANFVLPDGKILIVATETISSQRKTVFIKYNSDGTLDATYGANGKVQLPIPYFTPNSGRTLNAARQPDGKIVIAGADLFANQFVPLVARFNEDGTFDTTFAQGNGISRPNPTPFGSDRFNSVLIQPDGKILLVGIADSSGSARLFLMRYHSDGSVDAGFGTNNTGFVIHTSLGSQSDAVGNHFYLQSSGKFIVGNLNNGTGQGVYRFNADGTFDNSFTFLPYSGTNQILTVCVQADDKILVGGSVPKTETLEIEHTDARISRYNADGTIDTGFGTAGQVSFDTAGYSNDTPKGFKIMPDGQILVALSLTFQPNRSIYNGTNGLGLVRLSANGAVNGRLLAGQFNDNSISSIAIQPDGKILTATRGNVEGQPDGVVKLARAVGVPAQNYVFHAKPNFLPNLSLYRPGTNGFYFRNSINNRDLGFAPGDILAPADFIGNTVNEMTYFRPSNGTWYISRFLSNSDILTVRWGAEGDIPVPADYDGDGKFDIAVYRPSNGVWYRINSSDASFFSYQWGLPGDIPVPGNYDSDTRANVAVWRPVNGTWYIVNPDYVSMFFYTFGMDGDRPLPGKY